MNAATIEVRRVINGPKEANEVLNLLIEKLNLRNDAALSRTLEVAPPVISKIRHGRLEFGASLLIRAHEVSGMPIRELKQRLGQHCLPEQEVRTRRRAA